MNFRTVVLSGLIAGWVSSSQISLYAAQNAPVAAENRSQHPVTIPAGTQIAVRLVETIKADKVQPGSRFLATVDHAVAVSRHVLIPKGANAVVEVVRVNEAKLKGEDHLALELRNVSVHGRPMEVATSYAEFRGKNKRTGRNVAIGGGVGGVIGGIAGGLKGLAIGGLVGAGGGTVLSMVRGKHLIVPAETRLDFTLQSPVAVR